MKTGTQFKIMRIERDLTVREVAKAIGVTKVTMYNVEANRTENLRTYQKLATYYGKELTIKLS